eukprot:CAMPEP_0114474288 /NCGR_PEP_ID=MMETSP0104-20121206/13485_1 /TAXON_ID=37642 ORGANISM="Paraphysomonas imperforata, Strain PA2" /NCGR_SAMPLE_ID=MMETSP0104 /ASSEMBLY_ACC=CAM_ASM_000202 /LENGTH=218 /DNA_ID=CAMNT_0001648629 /DNA_START=46 /DNA_END=702 /DNA_ORIENTATION=+
MNNERKFPAKDSSYIHQVLDSTVLANKITPTWFKVSGTCYDAHSKYVSGYGRAIRNISVSPDCPPEFFRTEHMERPRDFTPAPKEVASRKAGVEASYVLPGGSRVVDQPLNGRRYEKLYSNKQLIMEPQLTNRSGAKVDLTWDSSRRNMSARPSSSSGFPLSPVKRSGRSSFTSSDSGILFQCYNIYTIFSQTNEYECLESTALPGAATYAVTNEQTT